jgi:hypothetical protein
MDRSYVHGNPTYGHRRGLALNSAASTIVNSHFSDIKGINQDTQAICGWNGPGPFLIENNHLEAAAENILFGGSDPYIPQLVPSGITIRRNLITKPLAWMSQSWVVKNLIEFKNAKDVVVEGNTIENNWASGQQGYSIIFSPRNQSNTAPWSVGPEHHGPEQRDPARRGRVQHPRLRRTSRRASRRRTSSSATISSTT